MSNFKSIGQGVRGLQLSKIGGFPLTLIVALTTVLRTNVLHCDNYSNPVMLNEAKTSRQRPELRGCSQFLEVEAKNNYEKSTK